MLQNGFEPFFPGAEPPDTKAEAEPPHSKDQRVRLKISCTSLPFSGTLTNMKKTLSLLFCLLAFALSAQECDQEWPQEWLQECPQKCPWWNGYYITFFAGGNLKPGVHSHYEEFTVKTTYKSGYAITGSIGSRFGLFRLEGELGYLHNSLDRMKIEEWKVKQQGYLRTIIGMANLYYDFRGWYGCVTPYVGIGLGYANTKLTRKKFQSAAFDGNDKGFAWQVMAGFSAPIHRKIDFFVEYRFLDTHLHKDLDHTVGGGLRYWF